MKEKVAIRMKYNFDQIIDRRNTACCRWDQDETGKRICVGIADMDFPVAPPITEALQKRLEHPIYSYTLDEQRRYDAVSYWQQSRHGSTVVREEVLWISSVMTGIAQALMLFTNPGDPVIVQPPVYTPFVSVTERSHRTVVENRLIQTETGWEIDYEGLDRLFEQTDAKVMLLCSPHNPVGIFYTKEELTRIVEICYKHGAILISDETHSDFYYHGAKHTPILLAGEHAADCCIQMQSTSKSFNVAGTSQAYAIIRNPKIRRAYQKFLIEIGVPGNLFAFEAMIAAYTQCGDWMDQCCDYLGKSAKKACKFINEEIPGMSIRMPDATFFLWPEVDKPGKDVERWLADEALVELRAGDQYRPTPGHNNLRICFGMPNSMLMEALERIAEVMKKHR